MRAAKLLGGVILAVAVVGILEAAGLDLDNGRQIYVVPIVAVVGAVLWEVGERMLGARAQRRPPAASAPPPVLLPLVAALLALCVALVGLSLVPPIGLVAVPALLAIVVLVQLAGFWR